MNKTDIQSLLEKNPTLKSKLFCAGFLFTDQAVDETAYPFYGLWQTAFFAPYRLLVSPSQTFYSAQGDGVTLVLVGHAYNPFSKQSEETEILADLAKLYADGEEAFYAVFNQLSGIFTMMIILPDGSVNVLGDPTCIQTTFYVSRGDCVMVSAHTNCIGDLLNLEWTDYAKQLAGYKFFKLFGNCFPGDLTPFAEVKRLVPNHCLTLKNGQQPTFQRFYYPQKVNETNEEIVDDCIDILHNSLALIAEKWKKPAISMTGGRDSKTTLACAYDLYDRFSYFSYRSSDSEEVDLLAAGRICEALGLRHTKYIISENDENFKNIEAVRALLFWNAGGIRQSNRNDVRKRCFFNQVQDFDVEVKSWVSEVGRSYYSKRFNNRTRFGKPTPRKCTVMYKFFPYNLKLMKATDRVFADYLNRFFEPAKNNPVEWQEQFFWEYRVPAWNGLVITGEHRFTFDIAIPYNNRQLLERFLSAPLSDRIGDTIYAAIRQKANAAVDEQNIAVTNVKHTKNRARFENLYYSVYSHLKL